MILFVIFVIWIAALSVAVLQAWDTRSTKSYFILVGLVLVLFVIIILGIFDPALIGV